MSRTYHHGNKAKERLFGITFWSRALFQDAPPKKPRSHDTWNWTRTPNSWIHEMMERPHRAQTRNLLSKVKDGTEDIVLPLVRKPHHYYW